MANLIYFYFINFIIFVFISSFYSKSKRVFRVEILISSDLLHISNLFVKISFQNIYHILHLYLYQVTEVLQVILLTRNKCQMIIRFKFSWVISVYICWHIAEAVVQRCSIKKVACGILQNSQGNTFVRVSFVKTLLA